MIDETLRNRLVSTIVGLCRPRLIVLFGSEAYGEAREDSDIDLAVIEDSVASKVKEATRIWQALRDIPRAKDIVVATLEEYEYYKRQAGSVFKTIADKGVVLYAR